MKRKRGFLNVVRGVATVLSFSLLIDRRRRMTIVTGDRYLESLERFVGRQVGPLLDGSIVLNLNPAGLHYVQSRIEALGELEALLAAAPVDYLRPYVSDLGDHRALEQLRRILRLLTSLKVVSVLPSSARDPTPLSLLSFGRLKVLEFRSCDVSTSTARGLLALRPTLEKIICHNSTVSCPIVKLVLRSNALTSLRDIENLELLEGLDLSYNIISKFSEFETLGSLPFLQNLLLEGNPICHAQCYRAQVFSYFTNSERLKLDEKRMDNKDFWKMKIIRSGRRGKPAGYGCYAPAIEYKQKGNSHVHKRKLSRIANIEDSVNMQLPGSETVGQESLNADDYSRCEMGESDGET